MQVVQVMQVMQVVQVVFLCEKKFIILEFKLKLVLKWEL